MFTTAGAELSTNSDMFSGSALEKTSFEIERHTNKNICLTFKIFIIYFIYL